MKFEIPKDRTRLLKYASVLLIVLSVPLFLFDFQLINTALYFLLLGFILGALTALSEFFGGKRREALGTFFGFAILLVFVMFILYLPINGPMPPKVCTMPAGMNCRKFYLSSQTDRLNITLVNGLQKTIVITNMSCTKDSSQFEPFQETKMLLGQSASFVMSCNDDTGKALTFEQGDTFSGKINIEYYFKDEGPGTKRKISGNVYVEAG